MDKNYGRGLVFDVARPFSPQMDSRPRAYDAIPALHKLSLFLEDATTLALGDFRVEAGRRARRLDVQSGTPLYDSGEILFRSARQRRRRTAAIPCRRPESHPAIGRRCRLAHQIPDDGQPLSRHGVFRFHPAQLLACESRTRRINLRLYTLGSDELRPACRTQFQNGRFASTPAGTTTSCR